MAVNTPCPPVDIAKKRPEVRCDSESTAQTVSLDVTSIVAVYLCIITISYSVLSRDAMRKHGLCCFPVSVRPSVCPSVTLVHCIDTAEDIVKLLCRPGRPIILVF